MDTEGDFTITLNATTLAIGVGRCSDSEANSDNRKSGMIGVKITTGTAPTAGCYTIYLLRDAGTVKSDGWAGSDAAFVPVNAKILGTIQVTNDADTAFSEVFDTRNVVEHLGVNFGIAIINDTNQAANNAPANHEATFRLHTPEFQDT